MPCMHPHINACTHEKYMHACLHTHTLVHVSLYLCRHVCVCARALCVCVYNARTSTDTPHANFLGVGGRRDLVRALNCCAVRHRVGEWNSHFDDLPGIAHHADDQQTHAPVGSGARAANPSSGIYCGAGVLVHGVRGHQDNFCDGTRMFETHISTALLQCEEEGDSVILLEEPGREVPA